MRSPGARLIRSAAAWRNARKSAPDPRQEGPLRRHLYAFLAAGLTAAVQATPTVLNDACYVRSEPPPSTDARPSESRPAQSHLGLRRRATQLVEVELTVAGENLSVCTVSGIARVRGSSGQEILVLPVRPGPGAPSRRDGGLCLVQIRDSAASIEISTTEAACREQSVCDGKVPLHGQRFELADRVRPGSKSPCFEHQAP